MNASSSANATPSPASGEGRSVAPTPGAASAPNAKLGELLSLAGQRVLVTGGSGGIGLAVVDLLRAAGAEVWSVDLAGAPPPSGAVSKPCDLRDKAALARIVHEAQAAGGLDALVHCAGITRDRVLWKLTDDDWDAVLDVNLDSAFRLLRAAAPILRARNKGSVVLVSSINGERGKFGQANYAASKAGLIGLAKSAARELGRFNVRVNVVAPGMVRTAMTEGLPPEVLRTAQDESALGRIAEPADVARAVLFLISDLARHVTGQVLRVDGGQLMA